MDEQDEQEVAEIEDVSAFYFTVNMLMRSRRTHLEIPEAFTDKTGWPGCKECALVTSSSDTKDWPVHFRFEDVGGGKRRATSVGHGWPVFLRDQKVKIGSLLLLQVMDSRSLAVTICHPDSPRKHVVKTEEAALRRRSDGPVFTKTVRASHLRPGLAARLDLPTSYWREVGAERFRDTWFTLVGPLSAVRVRSAAYVTLTQTFYYLSRGWSDFVALNDFKLGDTLQFAAVDTAEFHVSLS
ncbi:hypothetical protein M758_UG316100 [Ceratodon purpureus]|nr:hypothetical protein M758_UG316100 [Ceratodon purpureus]